MKRIADFAVFVAVVKAGTISEATNILGLSVASVSKYIARVEKEVGVRLLIRSPRGLKLTSDGEALYEGLQHLLVEVDSVIEQVTESQTEPRGALRITSTIGLGRRRISPLVSYFASQYPNLSVQLYLADQPLDMFRDNLDVAITIGEPEDASMVAVPLLHNPCVMCASPEYLKKRPALRTLADLARHDCLVLDCHGAQRDHWVLRDSRGRTHALDVSGNLVTDNSETLRDWVLNGYGVALKSEWDIKKYLDAGELVRVLPKYKAPDMDFYIVYPTRDFLPAKTRIFLEFLQENINNEGPSDDNLYPYRSSNGGA